MKILFIPGVEDYDALIFEQTYAGESVKTIIDKHKKGEPLIVKEDETEYEIEYRIIETPDIVVSREFIDFIKDDYGDYDMNKSCSFYLETASVPSS